MNLSDFFNSIFTASFIFVVIRVAIPLLCASLSAYTANISGLNNIAVEGIMLMSALMAVLGSYWTQSAWLGLLIAIVSGVVMALSIAFFSMYLGANSILVGIALNTFASSFSIFLLYLFTKNKGTSASLASKILPTVDIPIIKDIPIIGEIFSGHYVITYIVLIVMILVYVLIYKTPLGMRIKAAGLDQEAARSVGINVNQVRIISIIISGVIGALGGAYITMGYMSVFVKNMISGRGWIGIAVQGMAGSSYPVLILTTLLFSVFQAFTNIFLLYNLPSELINIIPYVAVLLGIVVFSVMEYYKHKKGELD